MFTCMLALYTSINEACMLYINNIAYELDLAVTFHSPLFVRV